MLHILAFQSAVLLFGGKHIFLNFFICLHFSELVTGQDKLMQGNKRSIEEFKPADNRGFSS